MDGDKPPRERAATSGGSRRLRVMVSLGRGLQELLPDFERVRFLPVGAEADPVQTLSVNPERTAILDNRGQNTLRAVGQGDLISNTKLGGLLSCAAHRVALLTTPRLRSRPPAAGASRPRMPEPNPGRLPASAAPAPVEGPSPRRAWPGQNPGARSHCASPLRCSRPLLRSRFRTLQITTSAQKSMPSRPKSAPVACGRPRVNSACIRSQIVGGGTGPATGPA